jgi:hypothetical protein
LVGIKIQHNFVLNHSKFRTQWKTTSWVKKKTLITLILVLIVLSVAAELTREQKRRCEQYISIFENDSPQLDYGFVDNFQNRNGFTWGRSSFTTTSGAVNQVVKRYTERKPDNPLAKYMPQLKQLADEVLTWVVFGGIISRGGGLREIHCFVEFKTMWAITYIIGN